MALKRNLAGTLPRMLWALPCSAIGLAVALIALCMGGRARWNAGALEVTYRQQLAQCGIRARALPFRAIVFGHVILAVSAEELQRLGPHERVHVAQYERWGPVFLLAYPVASLWQWLRGGDPYVDNVFEVQARQLGG
jgi:hypothetical protein